VCLGADPQRAGFVVCKRISFVGLQIGQDLAGASLEIIGGSGSGRRDREDEDEED